MTLKCIFAPLALKLSAILALGIPAMFGQDVALCARHRVGFYRPHRTSATHRANRAIVFGLRTDGVSPSESMCANQRAPTAAPSEKHIT